MRSLKKSYFLWAGIIAVIGFIIPLLIKVNSESWNSVLSLSFAILGTLATIATLIIAIVLYDNFGSDAKFKEKQADAVIELAQLLKKTRFSAEAKKLTYNLPAYRSTLLSLHLVEDYKMDSSKTLLFPSNFFENSINTIYITGDNYWLPEEIKVKMKFLEIFGLISVENPFDEQYVRLNVNHSAKDEWQKSVPRLTLEMFIINYTNLLTEIEIWLKRYSDVTVNLGF